MTERMDRLMPVLFLRNFMRMHPFWHIIRLINRKRTKKRKRGGCHVGTAGTKGQERGCRIFCRLMDMHLQTMYKIAWSYLKNEEDVADVLQETTLACYEKLGDLKQNRYFKTWMTRILINKCKDCP